MSRRVDPLAHVKRFDRFQQRHVWLAVPCATIKKFGEDSAGNLAALLSYYGFLSLFPLLLVFVTVLGYVLAGDQSLMESVRTSVLGRFPVIGSSIKTDSLQGSAPALVIGVLLSLLSGLAVTQAAQNAFNTIWGVPRGKRPNFLMAKLTGVMLLVILGVMFIVASAASGLVSGGLGGTGTFVLGVIVSLILNFALFMLSFKLLCSAKLEWRPLVPGSLVAAVLFEVLQLIAGAYIGRIAHKAGAYGTFALVIGVIAWLHVGAQMTVYCAEWNAVMANRQWPRSLFGADNQVVPRRDGLDEREVEEAQAISLR
jgi:membrane protein